MAILGREIKFKVGTSEAYSQIENPDDGALYFSEDTKEIHLNGELYNPDKKTYAYVVGNSENGDIEGNTCDHLFTTTEHLQEFVDSISDATIFFRKGTYSIDSLTLKESSGNIKIVGEGNSTVLLLGDGTTQITYDKECLITFSGVSSGRSISFENLVLDGQTSDISGESEGGKFSRSLVGRSPNSDLTEAYVSLSGVELRNFSSGVYFSDINHISIKNCRFINLWYGVTLRQIPYYEVTGNYFDVKWVGIQTGAGGYGGYSLYDIGDSPQGSFGIIGDNYIKVKEEYSPVSTREILGIKSGLRGNIVNNTVCINDSGADIRLTDGCLGIASYTTGEIIGNIVKFLDSMSNISQRYAYYLSGDGIVFLGNSFVLNSIYNFDRTLYVYRLSKSIVSNNNLPGGIYGTSSYITGVEFVGETLHNIVTNNRLVMMNTSFDSSNIVDNNMEATN